MGSDHGWQSVIKWFLRLSLDALVGHWFPPETSDNLFDLCVSWSLCLFEYVHTRTLLNCISLSQNWQNSHVSCMWSPHRLAFQTTGWAHTQPIAAGRRHGNTIRTPNTIGYLLPFRLKRGTRKDDIMQTRNSRQLAWQRLLLSCWVFIFEVFWCRCSWNRRWFSQHCSATHGSNCLITKKLKQVNLPIKTISCFHFNFCFRIGII